MAKKEAKTVEARVLTAAVLAGVNVKPDMVVAAPEADIKGWADIGILDPHPDAVAHAKGEGAEVVDLAPPPPAAEASAEPPKE